jgi:pimeloyl-ACP methyl ester carboxylesterase
LIRFVRRYRYWLLALLAIGLLRYGWTEVTRVRGNQAVSFRPAVQRCDRSEPLRYCVNTDAAGSNGDVVYHLHGRHLDERIWNDDTYMTALIQAQWQSSGKVPPTVVTVSYGPTWILTPRGRKPESGLLEDFMRRLPEIEARVGRPRRRILLGESMGGLNVLVAGLSYPSRFAKVAALCPGVYAVSPFASLSTMRAAMERTGAHPKVALAIWLMGRKFIADEGEWRRMSPLILVERAKPDYPALYLSCGLYDAYGNYEGTQRLASIARQHGVRTEWHPLYGGHCAVDVPSLAEFLLD